jgi:hypothetical protein
MRKIQSLEQLLKYKREKENKQEHSEYENRKG